MNKIRLFRLFLLLFTILAGCASVRGTLTPNASIIDFGTFKVVPQQPVKVTEEAYAKHAIGFSWSTLAPESISISPAVFSAPAYLDRNITEVVFDADGRLIQCAEVDDSAGRTTCQISIEELRSIVDARNVVLQMTAFGEQSKTTFGAGVVPGTFVNKRYAEFLAKIAEVRQAQ